MGYGELALLRRSGAMGAIKKKTPKTKSVMFLVFSFIFYKKEINLLCVVAGVLKTLPLSCRSY
jgi:hypothetical protein